MATKQEEMVVFEANLQGEKCCCHRKDKSSEAKKRDSDIVIENVPEFRSMTMINGSSGSHDHTICNSSACQYCGSTVGSSCSFPLDDSGEADLETSNNTSSVESSTGASSKKTATSSLNTFQEKHGEADKTKMSNSHGDREEKAAVLNNFSLFQRKEEFQALVEAFHRRTQPDSKPELILISGESGTGKTILAEQLREYKSTTGHFYSNGKFDQLQRSEPYAPIVSAISQWVQNRLQSDDPATVDQKRALLKQIFDPQDLELLVRVLPILRVALAISPSTCKSNSLETNCGGSSCKLCSTLGTLQGADAIDRFYTVIKRFLRMCTNPIPKSACPPQDNRDSKGGNGVQNQPLVMVIDDLQWADPASLALIESIVSDPENHGLVLIGTCRSDEVSIDDNLAASLRHLEDEKQTQITNIPLTLFNEMETHQFVQTTVLPRILQTSDFKSPHYAQKYGQVTSHEVDSEISHLIFSRTDGNIFFTLQYTQVLFDAGILVPRMQFQSNECSFGNFHEQDNSSIDTAIAWMWNQDIIDRSENNYLQNIDDIVSLTVRKLHSMPLICQHVLSICACIGSASIDEFLVSKLLHLVSTLSRMHQDASESGSVTSREDVSNIDVTNVLLDCEKEGLLLCTEQLHDGKSTMKYRFLHDKIQQAAYNLIVSEADIATIHLTISRSLYRSLTDQQLDSYVFVIVDQWIRGNINPFPASCSTSFVTTSTTSCDDITDEERCSVARLCLQAGEKSMYSNDFKTALEYFEYGASLLDRQRAWMRGDYNLILNLYNTIAEASCCDADFDRAISVSQTIIENGRCLDDKLRGYTSQIYALGAQMKFMDAVDIGVEVIRALGEKVPVSPGFFSIMSSIIKSKILLGKYKSDGQILRLPDVKNTRILSVLGIMNLLLTYTGFGRPDLFPLLTCRMVILSLKYGMSALASRAFSTYALLLNVMGEYDESHRFNRLSLKILDRYSSVEREWIPRIYVCAYAFLEHWKEPIHTTYEKLEKAYRTGLQCGDNEFGYLAITLSYHNQLMSGEPLVPHEGNLRSLIQEMKNSHQRFSIEITSLPHEAALILMGREDDPLVANGAVLHLEKESSPKLQQVTNAQGINYNFYFTIAVCLRMLVGYHLGDLDDVVKYGKKLVKMKDCVAGLVYIRYHSFYYGMAALALARKPSTSKRKRRRLLALGKQQIKQMKVYSKHCPENNQSMLWLMEGELEYGRGNVDKAVSKYKFAEDYAIEQHQERKGFCEILALAVELQAIAKCPISAEEGNAACREMYVKAIRLNEEWGAFAKVGIMTQKFSLGRWKE